MFTAIRNYINFLNKIGDADVTMYNKRKRLVDLSQYTVDIPEEMFDFLKVLQKAADSGKYEPNNWLKPDGKNAGHKANSASVFRHVAQYSCKVEKDEDSGLAPELHAACRLLMEYSRKQRGIVHPDDRTAETDRTAARDRQENGLVLGLPGLAAWSVESAALLQK